MHDEDPPTPHDPLLSQLAGAPLYEDILDGFTDGFGEAVARGILDSPERLEYLRTIAIGVMPGAGWIRGATERTDAGGLNLELLHVAMAARGEALPRAELSLVADADGGSISPSWVADHPDDLLAEVSLAGGRAIFAADDLRLPAAVRLTSTDPPQWVTQLLGEHVVATLAAGEPIPELLLDDEAHPVARYALGLWLYRWHPGTGEPERPFDDALLRVELGTLARQQAENFDLAEPGRNWLRDGGAAILKLAHRSESWSGWRRRIADQLLFDASGAYVDSLPEETDTPQIRRLHDSLALQDREARVALAVELAPEGFAVQPAREPALTAGTSGQAQVGAGFLGFDPRRVPPRSVSSAQQPVSWRAVEGDEAVEVQVIVAAGEAPVDSLNATVICDGQHHELSLPLRAGAYRATLVAEEPPYHVEIELHHPDFPGPHRPAAEQRITRWAIQDFVTARRGLFHEPGLPGVAVEELPERPFLAELVAWDPEL